MAESLSRMRDFRGKIKTKQNLESPRKFSPYKVSHKEASRVYDRLSASIYGHVVGDALGHLTETLSKAQAHRVYGSVSSNLELGHKKLLDDAARRRWGLADWTEESDLMLLLIESLVYTRGQINEVDIAKRMMDWVERGFTELHRPGQASGSLDNYTRSVVSHPQFSETPKHAAQICWRNGAHQSGAGNCAITRTSILGLHHYNSHAKVIQNAVEVCSLTHPDPRCVASCVAVSSALSLMMQQRHVKKNGTLDVEEIVAESYRYATHCMLGRPAEEFKALKRHMNTTNLKELNLGDTSTMSYTFKTLGAGFWALRQKDFRSAIQDIVMEGGDADANASVAGALLGCKLGVAAIPGSWLDNLRHKGWLDELVNRYLHMMERGRALPKSESAV